MIVSERAIKAAAEVYWNDYHGRQGGAFKERNPQEVAVIQVMATAKAALEAAVSAEYSRITPHQFEYALVAGKEQIGGNGSHGVRIEVGMRNAKLNEDEKWKIQKLSDQVSTLCEESMLRQNEELQQRAKNEKEKLLALFNGHSIYVEKVPNGYSDDPFFKMHPWFKVTTKIGRILIGWRKRVINIDWSETDIAKRNEDTKYSVDHTAKMLEDIWKKHGHGSPPTYDSISVHAYGYEEAKDIIDRLLA